MLRRSEFSVPDLARVPFLIFVEKSAIWQPHGGFADRGYQEELNPWLAK
jgi:hypothetical protein